MPLVPPGRLRLSLVLAAALLLGGCATAASLRNASTPLDTYVLNPLPAPASAGRSGSRVLFVADPTAPAAVASDRIAIKPDPIRVAMLGDGRWVEAAPLHVKNVLARSLANTGRFAFVTGATVGPLPDFTLLVDIDAFQAEALPAGSATPARVVASMTLSVVRDADARLVASRRFQAAVAAPATDARTLVTAFDAANGTILREAVPWATTVMTGQPGA